MGSKVVLTKEDIAKIQGLASRGLNQEQIIRVMGLSNGTFYKLKKTCAELLEAIKSGKAKGIAEMSNALYEEAIKKKNMTGMIFFLKCQAGWKETQQIELAGKDGKPIEVDARVKIYIPDNER